jgi:predicted nucleic acid-binding protein
MKVLVDTSVWSLAFRRRAPAHGVVDVLRRTIELGQAALIGPIRQELLSGIREPSALDRLRAALRAFPDIDLASADHERAAECFNACRAAGVQGSNTDFLICAVAERRRMPILTTDRDFERYATVLPIRLHPTERLL